ncbi:MAG: poly(A) polymerase [Polyangia bacterium]|jgi:poly(A) polymerase|nr:poly(A) polymerase [Polyangia bacterium]
MSNLHEPIDNDLIDPDALKVVRRLVRFNHEAYLVGGCVRDLLLGYTPKDFDVATSATPSQIRSLFRNARIIGRRFRLAHIFFGPKIIETSTFRKNPREPEADEDLANGVETIHGLAALPGEEAFMGEDAKEMDEAPEHDGAIPMDDAPEHEGAIPMDDAPAPEAHGDGSLLIRQDNVFGTAEDDALRRDFTMNGLFYDPVGKQVIDFAEGRADLERRLIRTIGDPDIRFQEDPVRILRAIKFAARLDLTIEPRTYAALTRHRESIRFCAKARVLEEIYRLMREGASAKALRLLVETGVQEILLPELTPSLEDPSLRQRLFARMSALDAICQTIPITNALLLGTISVGTVVPWETLLEGRDTTSLERALHGLMEAWTPSRRDKDRTRLILMALRRLGPDPGRRRRSRPAAFAAQEYFPDALALYRLCCESGETDPSTVERWEHLQREVAEGRSASQSAHTGGRGPRVWREGPVNSSSASEGSRRKRGGRGRARRRSHDEPTRPQGGGRHGFRG